MDKFEEYYESSVVTSRTSPDETMKALSDNVVKSACKYAKMRIDWEFMNNDEKSENDSYRTSSHNAFIDSLNILGRYQGKQDIDNSWREQLGEERKHIGDFACYIAYRIGIDNK